MGLLGPFTAVSAVGSVFAANIYDTTGSYNLAWQLLLIGMVPAGIIIMWLRNSAQKF